MTDTSPFRSDNKFMYCNADRMNFLIPNYFFDKTKRFAEDRGQKIKVFGLFNVEYFFGSKREIRCMKNPFFIEVNKLDFENQDVDLPGEGLTSCMVLRYLKDDQIMDAQIIEDSDNALTYVNYILAGKVPRTVPYSLVHEMWTKNQEVANVNFGVRSETEEMILALRYRNPKNQVEKFAEIYGKDLNVGEYDYIPASNRQVCQYASTFSSMTFEDIDSMITTSLNRTRTHGYETPTPVEDIIKM